MVTMTSPIVWSSVISLHVWRRHVSEFVRLCPDKASQVDKSGGFWLIDSKFEPNGENPSPPNNLDGWTGDDGRSARKA